MVIWLDWITIIISTIFLLKSYRNIVINTRYIVYLLFFLFYVLPLYLDCFFSPPIYTDWLGQGFTPSSTDFETRAIYDVLIILIQLFILNYKKNQIINKTGIYRYQEDLNSGTTIALYLGMIIPVLLTAISSSHKFILYTLQWREVFDASLVARYTYFEKMSYIGVACSLILLFAKKRKHPVFINICCIAFLYSCICIEGKRSIIFFAFLLILLIKIPGIADNSVPVEKRRRILFRLLLLGVVVVTLMVTLTIMVKVGSRGYDARNINELYTTTRIDFFRDDRVRLAIYSIIHSNVSSILEYPGQTLINIPLYFFPVDYVLNMHHVTISTYSMYLTSALLGNLHKAVMTPAIFAELVSNLGIIGFVIMPIICVWFSQKSDKFSYPQNVFILTSFVLLQMYDFAYVAYFIEFTIIICWMNRIRVKGKHVYIQLRRK